MAESDEYKTHITSVFSRASSSYGQVGPKFFMYFGKKLVEFADVHKGARVLDVACGRGAVLFPLSASVAPTGEVVGIDLAAGMLELTRNEIARQEITNVKVLKMDAENLEFPDASFDFVLCGLGLFFFPHPANALSEFFRVLKPGGRLVTSTFCKKDQDENDDISRQWKELHASFKDSLKPLPEVKTKLFDNEDEINHLLSEAGFVQIEVVAAEKTFYYRDEDEWWETAWSHGYRSFLERLDTNALANFQEKAQKLALLEKSDQGIPEPFHLLFSKAQKPKEKGS